MFCFGFFSHAQEIPTGVEIDLNKTLNLSKSIGGFLFIFGSVLAGIVVIVSGFVYFSAGSNTQKIKLARDILKGGLIGTAIIFGSGWIVNTVANIAQNPFWFFQ